MSTKKENPEQLPNALEKIQKILDIRGSRKITILLDYDGTLSPIVSDPDAAELPDKNRNIIMQLSGLIPIAIISGRDLRDLKSKIEIDTVIYAGSHGFDISGPDDLKMVHQSEKEITSALDEAEKNLNQELKGIKGVKVERKKFAIAVHYRNAKEKDVPDIKNAVLQEVNKQEKLKKGSGKKIMELKPDIDWNKGYAIDWLTKKLAWDDEKFLRVFIGDDITDEDAFETLSENGIGIMVGTHGEKTSASFALRDTNEVTQFLEQLKSQLK